MSRRAVALRAAAEEADPLLVHRERAAAQLARYEEKVQRAAWKAIREWLAVASEATLTGQVLTAAPGDVPPDPNAIPAHSEHWAVLAAQHIIAAIADLLGERFAALLDDDQTVSARPWQEQYLAQVSNRMADLPGQTFDAVRAEVQLGVDHGDGIPAIRDRVATVLSAKHGGSENTWLERSRVIARTETIGAYNGGEYYAQTLIAEQTETALEKVWLATIDSRTRADHFMADGQRVALGASFNVGGAEMAHPGDPTAPAKQVVQCRCTVLYVEADEETPNTTRRQLADSDDVAGEIDRRADLGQVRAFDRPDPTTGVQAAPGPLTEERTMTDTLIGRRTWHTPAGKGLAPLGKPTGDHRIFKPGGISSRELPLHLLYQESTAPGHDGAITVGRILTMDFTETAIEATGDFLDDPSVQEAVGKAVALVEAGLGTVSVDYIATVATIVLEDGTEVDMEWLIGEWEQERYPVTLEQVDEGVIIAATLVAMPAFEGAGIELDPLEDVADDDVEADVETIIASARAQLDSLTASSAIAQLFRPPAAAYADPKLTGPTALTVTDEGRVFGHLAIWGTCHVGYPGECVEPPKSASGYRWFHTGAVKLDDGTRIAVGNLTLGGGHADPKLAWRNAAAHYDETGYGIATVRAYEDEHGIAVAGWLNPGVTPEQIAELERSPLSGDWREIGGELDMIGALAVNSGGFPVPRYATGESGDRVSLVAAPGVLPAPSRKRTPSSYAALRAQLRREVLHDVRTDLARRAELDSIVASVGMDNRSRLDAVLAGLDD